MIARLWSARATPQNWTHYEKHFIDHVVPELRTQKGYVASNLLQREEGGEIIITVLSFWRSTGVTGRLRWHGPRSRGRRSQRHSIPEQLR